eukprot:7884916-Pyramimonas_sp.AAC.1
MSAHDWESPDTCPEIIELRGGERRDAPWHKFYETKTKGKYWQCELRGNQVTAGHLASSGHQARIGNGVPPDRSYMVYWEKW